MATGDGLPYVPPKGRVEFCFNKEKHFFLYLKNSSMENFAYGHSEGTLNSLQLNHVFFGDLAYVAET